MKLIISDKAYNFWCWVAKMSPVVGGILITLGGVYGFDGTIWGGAICDALFVIAEAVISAAKNGWNDSLDV